MNYNALAPTKYKRSVVPGLVHRIHRLLQFMCNSWKSFHDSLEKAKSIHWNSKQPTQFFEPIISRTLSNIIRNGKDEEGDKNDEEDEVDEKMVFIEYRGKVSDSFESSLKKLKVPCKINFTSKKIKMDLSSLKPPVEKCLKSRVVYKICCLQCQSCYVGQRIWSNHTT